MSFWGHLVTTLSDSGRSFLESTAKDISEFSSSLKEETKDLHLPSLPLPLSSSTSHKSKATAAGGGTGGSNSTDSKGNEGEDGEGQSTGREGVEGSSVSVPPQSLTSSTSSSLSSLSQKVFHFLPSFITSDSTTSTASSSSSSSSSSIHSTAPLPLSSSSSSPFLLTLLRSRSTYTADPIDPLTSSPPPSYSTFSSSFRAAFASTPFPYADDISALLRLPTVHRLHEELVGGGEVDEVTFWCRVLYQRGKIEDEEKKRAKLQSRLKTIQRHSTGPAGPTENDDLAWGDDEEEEEEDKGEDGETGAGGGGGGREETMAEVELVEEKEERGEAEHRKGSEANVDLRQLTMEQLAASLIQLGRGEEEVMGMSRWDRVREIARLSIGAVSEDQFASLRRFAGQARSADDEEEVTGSVDAVVDGPSSPSFGESQIPPAVSSSVPTSSSAVSLTFSASSDADDDSTSAVAAVSFLDFPSPSPVNSVEGSEESEGSGEFVDKAEVLEDIQQQQRRPTPLRKKNSPTPTTTQTTHTTTTTSDEMDHIPLTNASLSQPLEEHDGNERGGGKEEVRSSIADTPAVEEDYDEWE